MADTQLQYLEKVGSQRNPIQETEYQNLLKQSGGSSGMSGSSGDLVSQAQQLQKMYSEANQPAISSLQASIPTIGQRFAQTGEYLKGKYTDLKSYYDGLLASITGKGQQAEQDVTTATSQELGRRGISAESGLFGQTVNKAVQPVRQAFAGDINQMGFTSKSALGDLLNQISGLPTAQTEEEQKVQQAIAQLQAGGNVNAITTALDMWKQNKANEATASQNAVTNAQNWAKINAPTSSIETIGGRKVSIVRDAQGNITSQTDLGPSTEGSGTDFASIIQAIQSIQNPTQGYTAEDVQDYVSKYGLEAAVQAGILGPKQYQ